MAGETPLFTLGEVARAVDGELVGHAGGALGSVSIDSRVIATGALFVPLAGTRVDGHDYVERALQAGAAGFLVSRAAEQARGGRLGSAATRAGRGYVRVEDTLRALQALARWHLARYPGATRIAVTGSNGKTTTKELIGAILAGWKPTAVSPGNLNSETGLPLSCFRVGAGTRLAVFELGMNHLGEIRALADVVRPAHALITNIGVAHIGFCGSQEAIAREKKSIFDYFTGGETAYLPAHDPFLGLLSEGVRGRVVRFGPGVTRGFEKSEARGLDGSVIHWEGLRLRLPLVGRHNVLNALAAISVASELGVPAEHVRDGIEGARPVAGRAQILRGRVTVIADFYNASPESVAELLDLVRGVAGRRIGVFGSMRELGERTEIEHRRMGASVAAVGFDEVCFFGEEARAAFEVARAAAPHGSFHWTADYEVLAARLGSVVRDGDLVAVKGSRGVELERTLDVLLPGLSPATKARTPACC